MLTIAIQKSGRLHDHTIHLFKECGFAFNNGGHHRLKMQAKNFPLQVLFLRDDDIPECIDDGAADAGIVGENVYKEKNKKLILTERLGFAKCRLSISFPKQKLFRSIKDLNNLKIATSYPNILKKYLRSQGVKATIHEINGSVEIAPGIGMADAIFDIVSTGSTLLSNGLKEVDIVMHSEAVLIHHPKITQKKQKILDDLLFRIRAVNQATNYKYILLNTPNSAIPRISKILPGMKSPTVIPLADEGWSSIHSVIREDDFWEQIENLKKAGAEGILVIPIEKMII
jgi:ATP phosphoribosyltransferase